MIMAVSRLVENKDIGVKAQMERVKRLGDTSPTNPRWDDKQGHRSHCFLEVTFQDQDNVDDK